MANKTELRKKYKCLRDALDGDFVCAASDTICAFICECEEYKKASVVFVYSHIRSEVSTKMLISRALEQGKTVLLPVTDPAGEVMHASKIQSADDIVCGGYGITEPKDKTVFDASKIDVAVVPGLAFSRRGYRIGYGKGYYDRFFGQNPDMFKIGAAYSVQLCDEKFEDEFDARLDAIATEKGVILCEE